MSIWKMIELIKVLKLINLLESLYGKKIFLELEILPFLKKNIPLLVDSNNEILETYEIEVEAGKDTLPEIVKRLNQTINDPSLLQVSIEDDGSMLIQSGANYKFIFGRHPFYFNLHTFVLFICLPNFK